MCKAFPFFSGDFSIKCPVFSYSKVGQFSCDFATSRPHVDASEKFDRYVWNRFRKYFVKGFKLWDYDLITKNWVLVSNNQYSFVKKAENHKNKPFTGRPR